jgi:hypothetical protein
LPKAQKSDGKIVDRRVHLDEGMTNTPTSPSGSGPAGAHFEARVGGYYLLALLLDSEPRGLPGGRIDRVQFQGAGEGFPLDDVIVHAAMATGRRAIADIQVKRAISFSPGDAVFRKVASQVADAVKTGKLDDADDYVMAIATARTSWKIDGSYQEVLLWARDCESADTFFRKLNRVGTSNEAMRTFVETLRGHLAEFEAPVDDVTVWRILRKLQILVFDFLAVGGQTETLVRDRCAQALDASEHGKAGALWSVLCDTAQELSTHAGEITADTLRERLLNTHGLRLAGARRHDVARAVLFEASCHALNDIRDQIGGAKLARHDRLALVNASLDAGRYVEIRGDGGVGKSGILRALADQIGIEANVIALSPVRTIPRGWVAMRDVLGFDGSAKELLSDVAASGGAVLFLDSVDFFDVPAQATARDLIQEAAAIPGFKVVVTARRSFGTEEPSWLPADALDMLGRAPVVTIDELTDAEVAELRSAAPQLGPLLADGHPAREVMRNLFRLDWLVQLGQGAEAPRTETEMARLWWRTGDGKLAGARDRTRVLRDLAEKSLSGEIGPLPTSGYLSQPLEELVKSGTLRDLEGEQMTFRHDVFRDWAVANLLHEDADKISALPLSRPAPASLFRGVELAARLAIEDSDNADAWASLVSGLSQLGIHGSWRRASIVALIRSELSAEILTRAEGALLAERGKLLRELVRTLMALDKKSASEIFSGAGVAVPEAIAHLSIPVGPAWRRLVIWTLARADRLPADAIPDVAELFTDYASAMWALDPIVPNIVAQLHAWLMEIEGDRIGDDGTRRALFGGGLTYDRQQPLREYLRSSFLVFSSVKPELADQYVRFLLKAGRDGERSAESVITAPGNLAKAAPKALAELTATTLIKMPERRRGGFATLAEPEAFTHADRQFLSPSPARGPFLELLMAEPKEGLALVRRLVLHACTFGNRHTPANDDAVVIELESGPRRFPFIQSYFWSRQGPYYSVVSALMALEAWAHLRIDAGEDVGSVIVDVLGDDEVPAAYLLVIVDLVLSHWPKSRTAAAPFVGSPELLAWDRSRQTYDGMGDMALFGEKEPAGKVNRASLKKRASRGALLEQVLPYYAFGEQTDTEAVRKRLEAARTRLGPYGPDADFGDPHFMVQVALNEIERTNYQTRTMKDREGNDQTVFAYVSPEDEVKHLEAMQMRAAPRMQDANIRAEIALALNDRSKRSVDLADRAAVWAQDSQARGEEQQDFDQSILIAALLLMRDGDDALRAKHGAWARAQFEAATVHGEDPVHRMRNGLQFNPLGLATAGLVVVARHGAGLADARPLLELAVRGDPAAAHGFGAFLDELAAIDPRLPKAVIRCAFVGNIRPRLKHYDAKGDEDEIRKRQVADWRDAALSAEWSWLQGQGPEPAWPDFPDADLGVRSKTYIGSAGPERRRQPRARAEYYADHQADAVWLSKLMGDEQVAPEWLRGIAQHYRTWTSDLNGAGREMDLELSHAPDEWNRAYYRLIARSLSGLDPVAIDALCLEPVTCLPDEPFLDVAAALLLPLDVVYFDDKGIAADDLLRIRTRFTERLKTTSQWRRFAANPGYGIPYHLDGALGAIFLCQNGFRTPPECYVTAIGMVRAVPFIPLLTELAIATPSLFVTLVVLSTVSVSPEFHFVAYAVKAIEACMAAHPNDVKLWVNYGAGDKFCGWIAGVLRRDGFASIEGEGIPAAIEKIVSDLIRLGVSAATVIERELLGMAAHDGRDALNVRRPTG